MAQSTAQMSLDVALPTARSRGGRPRELSDRACDWCGAMYRPKTRQRRYCKPECGRRSSAAQRSTRITITCARCGVEFKAYPYRASTRYPVRYCSRACTRDRIAKDCEQCGQRFEVARSYGHRRFCSAVCVGRSRRRGYVDGHGYVVLTLPEHPFVTHPKGRIVEHRLVMAEHLARPLYPDETVHHKNGRRHDNRLENLELCRQARQGTAHRRPHRERCRRAPALRTAQTRRLMAGVCLEPGCPRFATNRGRCPAHQTTHANGSRSGRDLVTHNRWAHAVKTRDGYRCRVCGTIHDLQAHHIRPGYDLDAGITLCRAHHKQADAHAR